MAQGDFDPNATTGGTGIITSSTPSFTGYPTYRAGEQAQVIPIVTTTRATEAQLSAAYNKMSPVLRKALSQQLKDAGYKVPVDLGNSWKAPLGVNLPVIGSYATISP